MNILLSDLPVGKSAIIKKINLNSTKKSRLIHLGVIHGNIITCSFKSIFDDPVVYKVNNTFFALRKSDASNIEVTYE